MAARSGRRGYALALRRPAAGGRAAELRSTKPSPPVRLCRCEAPNTGSGWLRPAVPRVPRVLAAKPSRYVEL